MDYITPYCICQVFFLFFCWRLISIGRNKGPNKQPLQACLSFLSLEERYRSHQVFPCCQNIDLLSVSVLTVSRTFKQCQQTTTGGARCQNRTALLVPKTRVLPLHFILHINGTIAVPALLLFILLFQVRSFLHE